MPPCLTPPFFCGVNAISVAVSSKTPIVSMLKSTPENELFSSMLFWKSLIFALPDAAYLVRRVLKLNLDPTYHKF